MHSLLWDIVYDTWYGDTDRRDTVNDAVRLSDFWMHLS
jgi:hypothetical protein